MAYPVTQTRDIIPGREIGVGVAARGDGDSSFENASEFIAQVYGTRFNLLASHGRTDDVAANSSLRPFRCSSNSWHVPASGMIFKIPDHLPGSTNETTSTGVTAALRGGLVCRSYAQNALVEFGVRIVTYDGSGGLATAGAWNVATCTHAAGALSWHTADDVTTGVVGTMLYPSGAVAGDLIQLYTAFRVNGTYVATPAYLVGWEILEPDLIDASP